MTKELKALIEAAKKHEMSSAEKTEQIRSFAFGNTHMENASVTFADIDKAMEDLGCTKPSVDAESDCVVCL